MPKGTGFGAIEELKQGGKRTFRIRYTGPNGKRYREAGFTGKQQAQRRLATIQTEIGGGTWKSPEEIARLTAEKLTVKEYSESYMKRSTRKPRTDAEYQTYLDKFIIPEFGDIHLEEVTSMQIGKWYMNLVPDSHTYRHRIYSFMSSLMNTAIRDGLITRNPCQIRGAGSVTDRATETVLPEASDILRAIAFMPAHLQLAVIIAAEIGLRNGEVRALRKSNLDLDKRIISIKKSVSRYGGTEHIGTTKTKTSRREWSIPAHMIPVIRDHIEKYAEEEDDGLLFPGEKKGKPYSAQSLNDFWVEARNSAGCPGLRFHDLRHYAAVTAIFDGGAKEYEVMKMLGQKDSKVLRKYLDLKNGRMHEIAENIPSLIPTQPRAAKDK